MARFGQITRQEWFDRFTNTSKNNNDSCTTWDIAFDNCNPRENKRYVNYDSSKPDFMTNWDSIIMEASKTNLAASQIRLLDDTLAGDKIRGLKSPKNNNNSRRTTKPASMNNNNNAITQLRSGKAPEAASDDSSSFIFNR